MTPPPFASARLDEAGRPLLDRQLEADEAHVKDALRQLDPQSPICCLLLLYVADEQTPSVGHIYAWTRAARDEAFEDGLEEGLMDLWFSGRWDCDLDDLVERPDPTGATEPLAVALRSAGCDEVVGPYLMDLAHRLNRCVLPVATTEDFACWVSEHENDDEPWKWMTAVARPEVVSVYRDNGWLREPEGLGG